MKKKAILLSLAFILCKPLYTMHNYAQGRCAQEHSEWLTQKNDTCVSDVKQIVDGLGNLHFHLNKYCLLPDDECAKNNVLEAVKHAKASFNTVAQTIVSLGQSNIPELDSKLYTLLHQRALPITHPLQKACTYISDTFNTIESEIAKQENTRAKPVQLDRLCENIDFLFNLFNGSIKSHEIADKIKDKKFHRHCFQGIREWELLTENYAKKLALDKLRMRNKLYSALAQKAQTKVLGAKTVTQEISKLANKPDLSWLALFFLNPPFAVQNALTYGIEPFIKNYPKLSAPLIRAAPILDDVRKAMQDNMAPSTLMETARTAIPEPFKPHLIFVLQHFGKMVINPTLWLCSKGASYVVDTTEKFVDTILDEAKKPLLEDQLFPYLSQLGLCYQDLSSNLYERIKSTNKLLEQYSLHMVSLKTIMKERERANEEYAVVKKALEKTEHNAHELSKILQLKMRDLEDRKRQLKTIDEVCRSQRAQEVKQQYLQACRQQENEVAEIECHKKKYAKKREQKLNKLERIKAWFEWFATIINQKCSAKGTLQELRDTTSPLVFFQELFKEQSVSDELYAYYEELVISNSIEFRALVKKHYKSLHTNTITLQELFNTWFELMLKREHKSYKRILNDHYLRPINDIQSSIDRDQAELNKDTTHNSQRSKITRCFLWFYYLFKKNSLQERRNNLHVHQGLLETFQRIYTIVQNTGPYKFISAPKAYVASDEHKRIVQELLQKISLKGELQVPASLGVEIPLHEIKEDREVDIQVHQKTVHQQGADAECGYHALYNALGSIDGLTRTSDLKSFIERCKKRVVLYRNENKQAWQLPEVPKYIIDNEYSQCGSDNAQWICEDEITGILESYKSQKKDIKITLIPDIQKYLNQENQGLDKDVIIDVAQAQRAVKALTDYERVYILGTAQEQASYSDNRYNGHQGHGHWIAIKQTIKNRQVSYEVMNSMQSYDCKELVNDLIDLLHTDNVFLPVSDSQSEELTSLLTTLAFSKIFNNRCYALNPVPKGSDSCEVVNCLPADLLGRIISAANHLLQTTHGKPFHNCMGYNKPLEIVQKVIKNIEACIGQEIELKNNSNENAGYHYRIELSEEQEYSLKQLKERLQALN